jgi:ComF family protein
MAAHLASQLTSIPDCIIPVPLHPKRLCQRGFNQAQELANLISKILNIGIHADIVERFQNKPPQITLSKKLRLKNMRGVFRITNNTPQGHVLIIDDVMTTGATANELARILKRQGASRVDIAVVARTGDNAETLHN